jgi:hypothetical protein
MLQATEEMQNYQQQCFVLRKEAYLKISKFVSGVAF